MPTWRYFDGLPSDAQRCLSLKQDSACLPHRPALVYTLTRIQQPPHTLSFSLQLQLALNSGLVKTMMQPLGSDV